MSPWREVPTLSGRHVTLRPMLREDRAGLLEAFAGLCHLFHTTVPDDASIGAWMDRIDNDVAAGRGLPFTVLDSEGRIAGATRFLRMSKGHRRVEIGGTLY
ncbi:MAG TPA: GNAT family N-acetyltransferase, partial [Sphingomonas sp.]|nr:GNAT family N-acetyltransferase [Sphingomonas sp.]